MEINKGVNYLVNIDTSDAKQTEVSVFLL